jgi:hypothetical protein
MFIPIKIVNLHILIFLILSTTKIKCSDNSICDDNGIYNGNVSIFTSPTCYEEECYWGGYAQSFNFDDLEGCKEIKGNFNLFRLWENIPKIEYLEKIGGSLGIGHSTHGNPGLKNLNGLTNLKTIGKNLRLINNDSLENIDGLINIVKIGGKINIVGNAILRNLNGLAQLSSIGSDLSLRRNKKLKSIKGLVKLKTVPGSISIEKNAIKTLNGLDNIRQVGGSLSIVNNEHLLDITALKSINYVGNSLYIFGNNLTSLNGLENLKTVKNDIQIGESIYSLNELSGFENNPRGLHISNFYGSNIDGIGNINALNNLSFAYNQFLKNIILIDLRYLTHTINIVSNPLLESIDLSSIENDTIEQDIWFIQNDNLINFSGLEKIKIVRGSILIQRNFNLENFTGFDNLKVVNDFTIDGNFFNNLDGLNNLTEVNSFTIINNTLNNLNGLDKLETVNEFTIKANSLPSLEGLTNFRKVGKLIIEINALNSFSGLNLLETANLIRIKDNPYLNDISALSGMIYIKKLVIKNNISLSMDNINNLILQIGEDNIGTIEIDN